MTEAEFNQRRDALTRKHQVAAAMQQEAHKIEVEATDSLIDLLDVANQEPWWGEAND